MYLTESAVITLYVNRKVLTQAIGPNTVEQLNESKRQIQNKEHK